MGIFQSKTKKENEALKRELKGYYDRENEYNKLFKMIFPNNLNIVEFDKYNRKALRNLYENTAAVKGIITKIATGVKECAEYIELVDKDNNVIENHWINKILAMPNDRENLSRFTELWSIHKLVYGDVWTYCERTLGSKREIKRMYIIPSDKVIIKKGGWREPIKGIELEGSGSIEILANEDIWQSYYPNLDSESFYGFSPLIAASEDVQLIRNGKKRLNTSMLNGGVNTLITPKPDQMGLMPKDTEDLERELNSERNINKTKYLRQAIDVHKIGGTPVELSILDNTRDSVTALCFVYGMPIDLYYGQSKYENAREYKKTLYESLSLPLLQDFCNDFMLYLNREFPDTIGLKLSINTDKIDVLKASSGEVLDNLTKMGATLNEKRLAYGYPPIEKPYADEPMLPLGVQFGDISYDINENNPIE